MLYDAEIPDAVQDPEVEILMKMWRHTFAAVQLLGCSAKCVSGLCGQCSHLRILSHRTLLWSVLLQEWLGGSEAAGYSCDKDSESQWVTLVVFQTLPLKACRCQHRLCCSSTALLFSFFHLVLEAYATGTGKGLGKHLGTGSWNSFYWSTLRLSLK